MWASVWTVRVAVLTLTLTLTLTLPLLLLLLLAMAVAKRVPLRCCPRSWRHLPDRRAQGTGCGCHRRPPCALATWRGGEEENRASRAAVRRAAWGLHCCMFAAAERGGSTGGVVATGSACFQRRHGSRGPTALLMPPVRGPQGKLTAFDLGKSGWGGAQQDSIAGSPGSRVSRIARGLSSKHPQLEFVARASLSPSLPSAICCGRHEHLFGSLLHAEGAGKAFQG